MSDFQLTALGQIVWEDRYGLKDENGNLIEKNILETFRRVAKAMASKEKDSALWEERFYDIMANKYFCPAGRILAHAGTPHSQLLNCFVLPFEDDSLEAIMETAKNMAITQKFSGGTGFNYSNLRPSGAHIKGVNGRSCGVLGFMNMMSTVSEVIEQGGCLTEDSLINTEKGMVYFNELVKESAEGWHEHNLVVKSKDGDNLSKRYFINGLANTIKIETEYGTILNGTLNHKLYVFTKAGFAWKEFKDIKKGDYLIHKLNQFQGTEQELNTNITAEIHHNCIIPEKFPKVIDEKFAFFLGYMGGNGFATAKEDNYRLGISIPDKSYLNSFVESMFKDLFGSNISVLHMKKDNDLSSTYCISNKLVKSFLANNGLLKCKSLDTSIPYKIRCSPTNVVGSYLSGLFEADGAISHGYPQISTSSYKLAKEIQVLLFGLGIPARLFKAKRTLCFSKNDLYIVRVVSFKGLENWNKTIKHHPDSRFSVCSTFKPDLSKEKNYILPYSEYWLSSLSVKTKELKNKSREIKSLIRHVGRYLRGDRNFSLSSYSEVLKEHPFAKDFLPPVNDLFFDKVETLAEDKKNTFDIEVNEAHSYIANSLVSHNSRRGANLGLLEVSHPDIWEYISYKTEHNWDHLREFVDIKDEEKWTAFKFENLYKLQMYNISVGITDEFLDAVKKDTYWPLLWKDKEWELYTVRFKKSIGNELFKTSDLEVVADCEKTAFWKVKKKIPYPGAKDIFEVVSKRKIKASEIWDKICYNAWADGCPGLINLSTARKYHNLEYVHPVLSTNPCMTGETMVAVADGRVAVSIKQLAEEDKDIPVYCRNDKGRATIRMMRHPRITGYNQKILKVTIEGGHVLRVNETHKFTSSEGSTIVAKNLKAGDSLSIMTRLQAPFDYIVKNSNSKSQDYYWINSTEKKSWVPEHRLIYNFNHREGLFFKEVIHHRDFNGLNNAIGNLQLCSKKEHDTLHSINMFGNKNPMRRAQTEWSEEKWQQYRDNMSASVAGELNGRFSGISNEKLFEKAIEISKKYGKKLTTDEWEEYAKKEGYPSQFSQYRTDTFGTVCEFLDKAATTAQVPGAGLMNSVLSAFNDYLKIKDNTDLNIFFDEKAEIDFVKVRKICEGCKKEFIIPYYRREQGFCSKTCAGKNYVLSPDGKTKLLQAKEELRDKKRLQQINAFNDLKFKLGYLPMKKEYTVYCKENKIPFRLPVKREVAKGILIGTFHSWKELTEEALTHNHRVLSIEEDGFENVYNGTVDEYHNFYIGHFKENIDGHCKFIYVNNLQCGEQPIAKNSSCNLSSIVLPSLYNKDTNSIDYPKLKEIVHTAIRFSDNVIDNCIFPIPEIKKVALEERRIGLGTMGVHDLLIKMKLGYDSPEGRDVINELLRTIRDEAYKASIEIAEEKGAFPLFNKEKFTEGAFIKTLSPTIRKSIFTNGIRNGALTSQAPTGSTGTMYNCSTGCEPWFALSFQRNTRLGSYEDGCPDYIKWKNENPDKPKPSYFKTSQEISSEDHIKMMALFSKYICSAVSKTVNLPNSASVEDVKKAFEFAMEQGAKGITIFRDGSKEGVLVNKDKEKVIEDAKESVRELQSLEKATTEDSRAFPIQRGNIADGSTYRIPLQHHNLYVTVNKNDDGKLVEVFAVAGKSKRAKDVKYNGVENSWAEALGRLASLCLRAGVDPCSIISNLKNITSDKPVFGTIGRNENSELIPSPPHAIARVMEEALNRDKPKKVTCNQEPEKIETKNKFCTECGSSEITMKGPNCYECHSCGYSGCGG